MMKQTLATVALGLALAAPAHAADPSTAQLHAAWDRFWAVSGQTEKCQALEPLGARAACWNAAGWRAYAPTRTLMRGIAARYPDCKTADVVGTYGTLMLADAQAGYAQPRSAAAAGRLIVAWRAVTRALRQISTCH